MLERTFSILKPDAVSRGLKTEIFSRIEKSGLKIIDQKELDISPELAARLYKVHEGKPFYDGLIEFITFRPSIVFIIEGENAIERLRELMGATDPRSAAPGSIRGDLKEENVLTAMGTIKNLIHGSDSKESFEYESKIFFDGGT